MAGFEHFGLADAGEIGIRVIWPDGAKSETVYVGPNQALTLIRTAKGLKARR